VTDGSVVDLRWPPRPDRRTGYDTAAGHALALQQFSSIVAPVALGLVLVVGFHPLVETAPRGLTGG
jgi:hypothetical protein